MVVVADRAGRLGNKLLLSSHLIAASCSSGFRVLLPSFRHSHEDFPYLDGPLPMYPIPTDHARFMARITRRLLFLLARALAAFFTRAGLSGGRWLQVIRLQQGERMDLSDPTVRQLLMSTKLVVLQGWLLRDPRSLNEYAATIKETLTPGPDILTAATALVEEARGDGDLVVGVHIRQGDYRLHLGGRFYFSTDTYVRAMEQTLHLFDKRVRFLVTTDSEQDWSKFSHLPYHRSRGEPLLDLFTLASCDYICGPPSSFSIWASFYGDTPLGMIVSAQQVLSSEDFCVATEIRDPSVAALY